MINESYLRIIEIDKLVRASKYPNCQSLQQVFNVSERTVLRDIDFMKKSFKAPLKYSKSRNGYYYDKEFELEDIILTEGDLVSLLIGRIVLENYKETSYFPVIENAFKKISFMLSDKIEMVTAHFLMELNLSDLIQLDKRHFSRLKTIVSAINEKKLLNIVHIDYLSNKKSVTMKVKPLKLSFIFGEWFLVACNEAEQEVKYSLKNIVELRKLKTGFTLEGFKTEDTENKQFLTKIVVRFDRELADYVTEKVSGQNLEVSNDNKDRKILTFISNDLEGAYRWILSFGSLAEVIEPLEMRKRMRKDLLNMISLY